MIAAVAVGDDKLSAFYFLVSTENWVLQHDYSLIMRGPTIGEPCM